MRSQRVESDPLLGFQSALRLVEDRGAPMGGFEIEHARDMLERVEATCALPERPRVLSELDAVIANGLATADDAANVLSSDPAVATTILRILNSDFYALQVPVGSVNLAVSILGLMLTRKVTLTAALLAEFAKRPCEAIDQTAFWAHSLFVAALTRVLGAQSLSFAGSHPEDLFACGLWHDIGVVVLAREHGVAYAGLLDHCVESQESLGAAERTRFGCDHAEVGAALATRWGLPAGIRSAVAGHYEGKPGATSAMVALAEGLAEQHGYALMTGLVPRTDATEHWARVGVDPAAEPMILEQAGRDFEGNGLPWGRVDRSSRHA